ncbi:MAG: hypothetical protein HY788_07920 [Deltaproteobacteria bacterium]|nr:hypothetical protein [Deltaproteobacteria bacterium]
MVRKRRYVALTLVAVITFSLMPCLSTARTVRSDEGSPDPDPSRHLQPSAAVSGNSGDPDQAADRRDFPGLNKSLGIQSRATQPPVSIRLYQILLTILLLDNGEVGGGAGASNRHADLTFQDYPGNCLSCHSDEAGEMFQSTHYQWLGDAPDMVNGVGLKQGKLTNAVNSYCINIFGDWPVCGSCHVGRGKRPDDVTANLENIDCLVCHNAEYAAQRVRLPDGSMGVNNPTDSFVRNVGVPTRAGCLSCHAKAGGGDAVKRGDLSLATIDNVNPFFDVHMDSSGPDLACQNCHTFENHRVIGKGSDLRSTDDLSRGSEVSCLTCHQEKLTTGGHSAITIYNHATRLACQTCHIPSYAKVATETDRDWRTHHDGTPADGVSGPGHPYTEKMSDLIPVYRFWNRLSDNALLGDDARRMFDLRQSGAYTTSFPMGGINDAGSKLFPFKYKTATQPKTTSDHRLIALDTFEYLKATGNASTAIQKGLANMGYASDTPYEWVVTDTYQLLNHGIEPSSSALQCTDCHGETGRVDLQGELGYEPKAPLSSLCTQCHGSKEQMSFQKLHDKHVGDKRRDCGNCHNFSRPERDLR